MLTQKIKYLLYGIVFLLFTDLVFTSCLKQNYKVYFISDALKLWGDFKTGSYWIYSIDSLESEDSIYVYDYQSGFYDGIVDDKMQYREETIESSMKNENKSFYYELFAFTNDTNAIIYSEDEGNFVMYIYYKNTFINAENENEHIVEMDSILILNKWYHNILYKKTIEKTYYRDSNVWQVDTFELWIAKNVGIIKKHLANENENHTYELKRFNVL
ncbi:MAG: hypothetical protein GXO79_13475, partial [Chlorobi bacterium]|nr:hypothetical protein [Chlorobiota bacterium]